MRGCTVFSALDLKQTYHQIPVSNDSQKYPAINTHIKLKFNTLNLSRKFII